MSNISSLDLSFAWANEKFGSAANQYLPLSNITSLVLAGHLEKIAIQGLSQALSQGAPITDLEIYQGDSSFTFTNNYTIAIAHALPTSNLLTLIIDNANFNNTGAKALAEYIPKSKLQSIQIDLCDNPDPNCQFDDTMVNNLIPLLHTPNLQALYLPEQESAITDSGAKIIAKNLIQHQGLFRTLWINQLFNKQEHYISLKPASNMNTFSIGGPNITRIGFDSICAVLPYTDIPTTKLTINYQGETENSGFCTHPSSGSHLLLPIPYRIVFQFSETSIQLLGIVNNKGQSAFLKYFKKTDLLKVNKENQALNAKENTYIANDPFLPLWIISKTVSKNGLLTFIPALANDISLYANISPHNAHHVATASRIALLSLEMPLLLSSGMSFLLNNSLKLIGLKNQRSQQLTTAVMLTYNLSRNLPKSFSGFFWIGFIMMSGYLSSCFALEFEKYLVEKYLPSKKEKKTTGIKVHKSNYSSFFSRTVSSIPSPTIKSFSYVRKFFSKDKCNNYAFENDKVVRTFGKGFDFI